jgi:hypothetical protein
VFARHLPPSAELPHVLALDPATAAELAAPAHVTTATDLAAAPPGPYDAIAGRRLATPAELAQMAQRLRPGGRLILAAPAEPQALLAALSGAGLIHCLVETEGALTLYRGERPPEGGSLARAQKLASAGPAAPAAPRFLFLLVTQTPNTPAWKLAPGERVTWHAATLIVAGQAEPRLLAFSSLAKAVAFMQPAILAGAIIGVNKVAKFPAASAAAWPLTPLLNARFEELRTAAPGPPLPIAPDLAITGEE